MRQQQLIYDIGQMDYQTGQHWGTILGLVLAAVVAAVLAYRRPRQWQLTAGIAGFALLSIALSEALPRWEQHRLVQALQTGRVKITQGELRGYWSREACLADPLSRRKQTLLWENFSVGGILFGFYRDHAKPGFRNADAPPVDLHDGLPLRVSYLEDVPGDGSRRRILRLEIAESLPLAQSAATNETKLQSD